MDNRLSDKFNLTRFLEAQATTYVTALEELKAGQKRSYWMWFIFPQVQGLGSSSMAIEYAIRSRAEALAYLEHPILGARLRACVEALLNVKDRSAESIMGYPDHLKLQSSMTLFAEVAPSEPLFGRLLDKYYGGNKDGRTSLD